GCQEHGSEPVARRQRALVPAAVRRFVVVELPESLVIRGLVLERPGSVAAGDHFERGIRHAEPETALETGLEVAHGLELPPAGRGAPARIESVRRTGLDEVLRGQRTRAD